MGTVRFRNDHVAAILGFGQFCDSDLEVAFRRNACFVRNLDGVELLKGDRSTNLYTINLHDMASASPICLMARASSTKSWLWHQRLSHLNFDTINDLARNDLAEAIATACFTQNRSIIHRRFNKTPYELINGKKPDISFLHVFGALCYPKNDCEDIGKLGAKDIGKLGAKGDIGFFIGYSADSCAYRVYNRRKKKIMETMNVSFDEISAMAFEQRSSKPGLNSMTYGHITMYDDYIGGQLSATARTVPSTQEHQVRQTSTASTTIADTAPIPTNSSSLTTNIPISSQDVDELNLNAMVDGNTFVNPYANSSTSAAASSSHQNVIQICLWCVDSGCSKHMTGNLKLLINFVWKFMGTVRFGNDHVTAILGFGDLQWGNILITRVYFVEGLGHNLFSVGQFCDSDLEVAFRRNACFFRNFEGVDLLKGYRSTNLYAINLHEMASVSPIFLMARASSTKSWLWHQRLSHLNFETINDLARNDLVAGLLKFKYHKEHLCASCEQGKSKRASHPPKPVPNSRQRLHLLHMDLCGPMRISSINGKRYILVIVDDYSRYTWVHFLRSKDEAPAVIITFLKMITNDREDIGKLGVKGDTGFFIGYSADSCAYRIYNRRTKKIIETMNVSFYELSAMAFEQRSSKPRLQSTDFRPLSMDIFLHDTVVSLPCH
nr:retrovirus-related Pol polyprotein from transposon TNT 1-94 [Tanacetum cinerariifolium]